MSVSQDDGVIQPFPGWDDFDIDAKVEGYEKVAPCGSVDFSKQDNRVNYNQGVEKVENKSYDDIDPTEPEVWFC